MFGCGCDDGMVQRPTMLAGFGAKAKNADQIVDAIMPNVQAQLAADGFTVQGPPSHNLLDAFGAQNRSLVMIGGMGLGLVVLMKMLK